MSATSFDLSAAGLTRRIAGGILAIGAATIAAVYLFQYGLGYIPCKLCLEQRIPYYVAIPLAALLAIAPRRATPWKAVGFAGLAALFAVSMGLAVYHAGVEWNWWLGPNDCGGGAGAAAAGVNDFLGQLNKARIVSCDAAAFRFLGLSLAGWNVLVSLVLILASVWGLRASLRR